MKFNSATQKVVFVAASQDVGWMKVNLKTKGDKDIFLSKDLFGEEARSNEIAVDVDGDVSVPVHVPVVTPSTYYTKNKQ